MCNREDIESSDSDYDDCGINMNGGQMEVDSYLEQRRKEMTEEEFERFYELFTNQCCLTVDELEDYYNEFF